MNRAECAGNCGADPHFASRHSLSNAAIEVLENRCLLSQTVVYSYNGPDYTTAPGVTANWYSTPENSVGGNTLKGLNGNTSRPLVLNNLPAHSTISVAFDLVTTGTFSGGNFAVVQRTVGPGPSYTVTHTTRLSDTISHSGSGVTYTRYRVEFAQSDNRLDLQFNMSGVPHNPGSWGIDNVSIVNDRETPEVSIAATTPTTTEGSSTGAVFTVTRTTADEALDVIVRVPQTVQGTNGLAAPGADYSTNPAQDNGDILVQFARNETSKTIVVMADADALVEGDETVVATVHVDEEDDRYVAGEENSAEVVIKDLPVISVAAEDGFASETDSTDTARFRITAQGLAEDGQITVFFQLPGGLPDDATIGDDYDSPASPVTDLGGGIFATTIYGHTGYSDVVIAAKVDLVDDPDEIVRLELLTDLNGGSNGPGYYPALLAQLPLMAMAQIVIGQWSITAFGVDLDGQGVKKDTGNQSRYDADTGGLDWVDHDADGVNDANGVNNKAYPISYVRSKPGADSFIKVKPEFFVSAEFAANVAAAVAAGWKIVGDDVGTAAVDDFVIAGNDLQVDAIQGGFKLSANKLVASATKLGDTIWHGDLKIKWRLENAAGHKVDYGKGANAFTENKLYVTGAATAGAQFHTVLEVASKAHGLPSNNPQDTNAIYIAKFIAIADVIYADFTDRSVSRVDGTQLQYWGEKTNVSHGVQITSTTASLLSEGDGRCGAWAMFFRNVLLVHGISTMLVQVVVDPGFTMPQENPPQNTVESLKAFDVGAVAAQGNPTPFHVFNDHVLVAFGLAGGPIVYYDPSYGTERIMENSTQAAEMKWEKRSIDSIRWLYRVQAGGSESLHVGAASTAANKNDAIRRTKFNYQDAPQ